MDSLNRAKHLDKSTSMAYSCLALLFRDQSWIIHFMAIFFETPVFTRRVVTLLNDDDYAALQQALAQNPKAGDVIQGSGGLRKLRWGMEGRGKRSGARLIYYYAVSKEQFYMLLIYGKNEQDDLSADQLHALRRAVEAIWP